MSKNQKFFFLVLEISRRFFYWNNFFQVLIFFFIVYNRKRGIRSSGVQFFFWLILAVCGIFQLRTEIKNLRIKHIHSYPSYLFYTIYYSFVLLLLFLSSLNDRPATDPIKKNKVSAFISWRDFFCLWFFAEYLSWGRIFLFISFIFFVDWILSLERI